MDQDVEGRATQALKENPGKPFCFDCLSDQAGITSEDREELKTIWLGWSTQKLVTQDSCSACKAHTETMKNG